MCLCACARESHKGNKNFLSLVFSSSLSLRPLRLIYFMLIRFEHFHSFAFSLLCFTCLPHGILCYRLLVFLFFCSVCLPDPNGTAMK